MLPYQKYPSIYKQQDYTNPPQSPFDVAYGSSLLPRQLLVSSPFIQVPTPLTSPYSRHHHHNAGYFVGPPAPQLAMPPRRRIHQRYADSTPSKKPLKMTSNVSVTNSSFTDDDVDENDLTKDHIESTSVSSNLYNSANSSNSANLHIMRNDFNKKPTRSILLSNLNPDLTITEFLNHINFGPVENVKLLVNPNNNGLNSIVLTFLKTEICFEFFKNLTVFSNKFKKLFMNSKHLSVNFINIKKILPHISMAIDNDGASRNVFIGNLNNLNKEVDEEFILNEFQKFGNIEKIDLIDKEVINDKNEKTTEKCAFIHFTSIASAIKTVEQLSLNSMWSQTSIFYGTDRCSIQSESDLKEELDKANNEEIVEETSEENDIVGVRRVSSSSSVLYNKFDDYFQENNADIENDDTDEYGYYDDEYYFYNQEFVQQPMTPRFQTFYDLNDNLIQNRNQALSVVQNLSGLENSGNRTICLSNLDSSTTVEDICNVVRGGILQQIKIFPHKRVCFITFIETSSATQFFAQYQLNQMNLHGKRIRIGWGVNPGPVPTKISLAVTVGASRNVYIGIKKVEDEDTTTGDSEDELILPNEEELRKDFEQYGDIEQINYFKNNSCVFLNFLNISNSIRLVSDANGNQSHKFNDFYDGKYSKFKISYGKDRCGNPPKAKKKKLRKRNNKNKDMSYSIIKEETAEEVPSELFASMGISNDSNGEHKVEEESVDAFGISTTVGSQENIKKKTVFDLQDSIKEEVEDDDDDDDDDDDVEIITSLEDSESSNHFNPSKSSNDFTPSRKTSTTSLYKKNKSTFSRSSSRNSSKVSLNSYYNDYVSHPQQQFVPHYYQPPPYQPQFYQIRPQIPSAKSSPQLGAFQQQALQPRSLSISSSSLNRKRNLNSTNGSQVMAQYLQQSQHANLLYAANVLSVVDGNDPNGEPGYYGAGYRHDSKNGRQR